MGELLGGGSHQQQSSQNTTMNRSYELLRNRLTPSIGAAQFGIKDMQDFLHNGMTSKFKTFMNNTGYDFAKDRGEGNIMTMLGASGLRNSGAAMKKLTEFNTDLRDQYIDKYLAALGQQSGLGLQAANAISGAGGYSRNISQGSSNSSGGIGDFLGSALSAAAIASDRRLKENVKEVGKLDNGLTVYSYNYVWDKVRTHIGVMAQDVQKAKPEALGPEIGGYMTVNYGRL